MPFNDILEERCPAAVLSFDKPGALERARLRENRSSHPDGASRRRDAAQFLAPFRAYFRPAASRPTEDSIFDVSRARIDNFTPRPELRAKLHGAR